MARGGVRRLNIRYRRVQLLTYSSESSTSTHPYGIFAQVPLCSLHDKLAETLVVGLRNRSFDTHALPVGREVEPQYN